MARTAKQSSRTSQIDCLTEQIFIQMCATTHHGFDATHYVRKAYEFAQAYYQNIENVKQLSQSTSESKAPEIN